MAAPTQDSLLTLFDDLGPEAVELKPVLQALATEVRRKAFSDKLTDLPAFQAVRKQNGAYQGRVALALAAAMRECGRRQDHRTRYPLGEALTGLMRGPLTLSEADFLRLFQFYGLDFTVADNEARRMAACQVSTELASASRTGPVRSSNSTAPLM